MFNYSLSKEIYGGVPWHVDLAGFSVLNNMLADARNSSHKPEVKNNTPFLTAISDTRVIEYPWQLRTDQDFEGVGVININGAITNSGGESSYGMLELSNMMLSMSRDSRVKGFIVLGDSGGGSSMAVETMGDAILEVRKSKKVFGVTERGGMAASAMYGILSYCEKIFSQSEMSTFGSVGTMIQFGGIEANKEIDGVKYIRLYATKSTKKNEAFEEAVNKDNYTLIINDLLNPINERFISKVLQNRPSLKGTNFDTGVEVYAKDGIGTYIDGIASFKDVVEMILNPSEETKSKKTNSNNNSNNSSVMDRKELQSKHPEVYNEIYTEGVTAERDRVGAWMAHKDTDSTAVAEGIESGKPISQTQTQQLLVKAASTGLLQNMASSSAAPVNTPESTTEVTTEQTAENKEAESIKNEWETAFK